MCKSFKDVYTLTWGVINKANPQGLKLSLDLDAQVELNTGIKNKKVSTAELACTLQFFMYY